MRNILAFFVIVTAYLILTSCNNNDNTTTVTTNAQTHLDDWVYYDPFLDPDIITPEKSTFFATVYIEDSSSYNTRSDGDLWPYAWSDDDILYLANGDGKGFDLNGPWADIVLSKITSGSPDKFNIKGERIYPSTPLGQVWNDKSIYNRKPTGMISVDGVLYLAVQDLGYVPGPRQFNGVPSATIIRSEDKGLTWTWDETKPMFDDYTFTTIFFLDYGKDSQDNIFDNYVYAYGLDYNWRYSASGNVPHPTNLYLARIPKDGLQDVSKWEFYAGDLQGNASWSAPGDISSKKPVLTDERQLYRDLIKGRARSQTPIAQGSIVYNKGLNRYIYLSWTEFTFEFYEAPTPWGPWRHFFSREYLAFDSEYKWNNFAHGGYATVAPSKYISPDGRTMWVNSNTFVGGINVYSLSFRKLILNPYQPSAPENKKSDVNLALPNNSENATPISKATRLGLRNKLNDGVVDVRDDSFNNKKNDHDYWGITWTKAYNMNEVIYYTGKITEYGGWFKDFKVQVRQNQEWIDVENLHIDPTYTFNANVPSFTPIRIKFKDTWGDGVRIIGIPGGIYQYTSIAELEVYYRN